MSEYRKWKACETCGGDLIFRAEGFPGKCETLIRSGCPTPHECHIKARQGQIVYPLHPPAALSMEDRMTDEALKPMADGTHVVVPREPTREMWGNDLVRLLIRWCGHERPTPKRLLQDLEMGYGKVPPWLEAEAEMQDQDHVVSKGTRAVFIYRAMIAAAPAASPAPFDEGVVERIVKAFEGVLLDINFSIEQGILPNIMNDMIYVEARAALAAIKGVE